MENKRSFNAAVSRNVTERTGLTDHPLTHANKEHAVKMGHRGERLKHPLAPLWVAVLHSHPSIPALFKGLLSPVIVLFSTWSQHIILSGILKVTKKDHMFEE